jgi:hypothetical protein
VANKIFTTFTSKDNLEQTLDKIKINYTILYSKIFVFSSPETEEFICTYNVDQNNCTKLHIIENTLLLHRKKATKTLFSINAINILNEMHPENGGEIKWEDYKESILLTRRGVFTVVPIQLHDIIFVQ